MNSSDNNIESVQQGSEDAGVQQHEVLQAQQHHHQQQKRLRTQSPDLLSITTAFSNNRSNPSRFSSMNSALGTPINFSGKPEPRSLAEFLQNPTEFCPKAEYLTSTLVEDETVLTHCIKTQNEDAVRVLLLAGADPNAPSRKGVAPISAAAHKGNIPIMEMLIETGAVVNAMNSTGSTALIQAAHFGHGEAVKLLLRHNASSDFANVKGTTALMRASQEGHVDIAQLLIASDVDVNRKNHEGMNALMLASQRGHASIVEVLVKAGAAMDEQTSQGSTALMLACKRGHEKCAEVLVSMGAEIFMRDRRFRTARDTATRRNHHGLLCWLDTQVQVRRIQEERHLDRHMILHEMREAHKQGKLRLNPTIACAIQLFQSVHDGYAHDQQQGWTASSVMVGSSNSNLISSEELLKRFRAGAASEEHDIDISASPLVLPIITAEPEEALQAMAEISHLHARRNDVAESLPVFEHSSKLAKRVKGYVDFEWPMLLMRCMNLTGGLFETIMEFLPLPRIWQWSLLRLKRRCKLAPHQAVQDISTIMDEILKDTVIFADTDQRNLLMKINRTPQVHEFLIHDLGMPRVLLDALITHADTQGLLQRSSDVDVSFKSVYARDMLATAVNLFRWHRMRTNALKALGVGYSKSIHMQNTDGQPIGSTSTPATAPNLMLVDPNSSSPLHRIFGLLQLRSSAAACARASSAIAAALRGDSLGSCDRMNIEGEELMEVTDVGAEEASDFEGEFVQIEPDTETEMAIDDADDNADALADDSDFEGDAVQHTIAGGGHHPHH